MARITINGVTIDPLAEVDPLAEGPALAGAELAPAPSAQSAYVSDPDGQATDQGHEERAGGHGGGDSGVRAGRHLSMPHRRRPRPDPFPWPTWPGPTNICGDSRWLLP